MKYELQRKNKKMTIKNHQIEDNMIRINFLDGSYQYIENTEENISKLRQLKIEQGKLKAKEFYFDSRSSSIKDVCFLISWVLISILVLKFSYLKGLIVFIIVSAISSVTAIMKILDDIINAFYGDSSFKNFFKSIKNRNKKKEAELYEYYFNNEKTFCEIDNDVRVNMDNIDKYTIKKLEKVKSDIEQEQYIREKINTPKKRILKK